MKDKGKQKDKGNVKNKNKMPEEKEKEKSEDISSEKPKIKNLERFIYITTYDDSKFMSDLKKLFEEINHKAFNLVSPKEIYSRELEEAEKNNNEIDYISGFQLIDNNMRITIIEGVTGRGIKIIKDNLPRKSMNTEKYKIFCDSNVLFDQRIYSEFGLSLKFIKLQKNLLHILQTFDIYEKVTRYPEIYKCFQMFGSLLKISTIKEADSYGLFPTSEYLLLLERKYGDLLTEQDMKGI